MILFYCQGLQTKLNSLAKYCDEWCLQLNPSKTKVLVFNKAGRLIENHKFTFSEHYIECVQHCKYLGIYVSASGNFCFAQSELYKKSLKAYFKLQKYLLSLNPDIDTSIHVFDHTIKPILLYGSEIWGSFNTQTAKFKNDRQITLDHIFNNLMCEKLRIKFGKFILGVHRKTTNQAVLSQIGRFPIYFGIIKSMLNYWQRLEYLDSLQKVFQIIPGFLDIKYKKK